MGGGRQSESERESTCFLIKLFEFCRATENPSESGGSFDASGAFHGGGIYSDDEEVNIDIVFYHFEMLKTFFTIYFNSAFYFYNTFCNSVVQACNVSDDYLNILFNNYICCSL